MFESSKGAATEIRALTGIRAVAAFWVISLHFSESLFILIPGFGSVSWLVGQGNYGVDLFFLLSGMIMMHVYGGTVCLGWQGYRIFVWRRFARIYPAYLVSLLGMIGLVLVAGKLGVPRSEDMYPIGSLPFEFLMIQAWGPLMLSWNYPAWSVSAEWFAYLFIFPCSFWLFRKMGSGLTPARRLRRAVFLIFGFLGFLALSPRFDGLPHALVRVSCEFFAGAMLYLVLREIREPKMLGSVIFGLALLMVIVVCAGVLPLATSATAFLMLVGLSGVLLSLGVSGTLGAGILSRQPWTYLGEISYSLSLIHAPVQRVLKVLLPAEQFESSMWLVRTGIAVAYLVALVSAAAALYHIVECPARSYLRRLGKRKVET